MAEHEAAHSGIDHGLTCLAQSLDHGGFRGSHAAFDEDKRSPGHLDGLMLSESRNN